MTAPYTGGGRRSSDRFAIQETARTPPTRSNAAIAHFRPSVQQCRGGLSYRKERRNSLKRVCTRAKIGLRLSIPRGVVFHFLTDPADRRSYVELARQTVPRGGYLVIATFADDGPERCSDLDVCRYNAHSLASELGEGSSRVREAGKTHTTPWGSSQAFVYGVFKRP